MSGELHYITLALSHSIQASVFTYVIKLRQQVFTVVFSRVIITHGSHVICKVFVVSQKHPFQTFLFMARGSQATEEPQLLTLSKLPVSYVIKQFQWNSGIGIEWSQDPFRDVSF